MCRWGCSRCSSLSGCAKPEIYPALSPSLPLASVAPVAFCLSPSQTQLPGNLYTRGYIPSKAEGRIQPRMAAPVAQEELPILEAVINIRNRLTALKKDRGEYIKPSDVNTLYQAIVKQVTRLNEVRDAHTTYNNRLDTTLADVFNLLSLFFLTIGKTKECPATYSQIASMRVSHFSVPCSELAPPFRVIAVICHVLHYGVDSIIGTQAVHCVSFRHHIPSQQRRI